MSDTGGIGGLLALSDQRASASNPTNYFYHADGNGNVVALINQRNEVVARYLFDPFGNPLLKDGPLADFNRQQFSSKEWHAQSGLLLYEFRAYDPNLQRWLNQDPIGEAGGINLYQFAYNDSINWVDALGLQGVMGSLAPPLFDPGPAFPPPPPAPPSPAWPLLDPMPNLVPGVPVSTPGFYQPSEPSTLELMMMAGGPEGQLAKGAGKLLGAAFVKCKPILAKLKAAKKPRSPFPPGRRYNFRTRKSAREAAERASPVGKAVAEKGPHGPHYHPVDAGGKHLNHDHYYFPERFW
jgi:RHS repeat-associated protein